MSSAEDPGSYLSGAISRARSWSRAGAMDDWLDAVSRHVPEAWFRDRRHDAWADALATIEAAARTGTVRIRDGRVCFEPPQADRESRNASFRAALMALHPWRKGPFQFADISIDAEWRSDLKWQRLAPHIAPLGGRRVLDVGCGNGYYMWRMWLAGARFVVGLDPQNLAVMQFRAALSQVPGAPLVLLPAPSAALDRVTEGFDTVFSMGVLYHRRDPREHLAELRRALAIDGELVLETLIVHEGPDLVPSGRYARMRNVWVVPARETVLAWLERSGFAAARCVDISRTTVEEQRATPWMHFESLVDCLDPGDQTRTVEGHPAPVRAIFVARAA